MNRVREALRALPGYFSSATNIEGLAATDLFAVNTVLGATIEVQVVETLNRIRDVWDPDDEWPLYSFERQAQNFPDVLLKRQPKREGGASEATDVALGIELKGWYILSKEGEPSFRYKVTPDACADWDILAVVPWHLANVLSGKPCVLSPGLWSAKHAAELRNHHWQHRRKTSLDTTIVSPSVEHGYQQRNNTQDRPKADGGGNFGRIARIALMDDWVAEILNRPLAGIPVQDWIKFLKEHKT